jgi:hypothetical protein
MARGVERIVLADAGAKVPRNWKVEDRGQASETTGLRGIEADSRLIAEDNARRAQENAQSEEEKSVQGVVAIYHADPRVLGTLHHESPMTDHPYVSSAIPTPFENLAAKEEKSGEQRQQILKIQFLLEAYANKPRHFELLRVLLAECSNPETAGLLYKGSGQSRSLDHKRLLDVMGPSWTIAEIRSVWADITSARRDLARKQKLAEDFATFVEAEDASQGTPTHAPDAPETKRAGATHAAALPKSRVKP